MGIGTTDDEHVLIFDNVSGLPVPLEVFENAEHADSFLRWHADQTVDDLRTYNEDECKRWRQRWIVARFDEQGFLLPDGEPDRVPMREKASDYSSQD